MLRKQLFVAAVAMDKFVLKREGHELGTRFRLPGERLDLHRHTAVPRAFLDDDDERIIPRQLADAIPIEWLQRMDAHDRRTPADASKRLASSNACFTIGP